MEEKVSLKDKESQDAKEKTGLDFSSGRG